ncbi:hypothetical protein JHK87_004707 [Glycine soja]|nr:hypothetical protein JHK87_004707 [Glycine soja]
MPDAETLEFVQNQKKGPLKGGSSSTSPDSTKLEEPEVRFVENITNMETEIQVEDQKTSTIIDVNNEALGEVNASSSNPPDYIVWNTNSDGVFTICEACTQLAKELRDSDIRLFDFVWRWNGPEHIRIILWKIAKGILPRNGLIVMGFGIIKLNYDATSIQGDLFVACGGLIRDDHDNFIHDFSQRIGRCSIVEVELWSILYGMRLVADRHMKKVIVESDSLAAINLIHEGCPTLHPCFGIVEEIKNLYNEFEHCRCRHILREANILANTFAKHGLSISIDCQFFCNVPTFALDPFQGDVSCIFGQLTLN